MYVYICVYICLSLCMSVYFLCAQLPFICMYACLPVSRPCALYSSVYTQHDKSHPSMFSDDEGAFQREKSLMGEMVGW